jgi:hypothetical protein
MIDRTTVTIGLVASAAIAVLVAPAWAQYGCWDNYQCPFGYYCEKVDGNCDGLGTCSPRPELCFAVYLPVCGCDGMTYSNGCYAARAGVNVAYPGECGTACWDDWSCAPGQYCKKPTGDCWGPGHCQLIPSVCPTYSDPVCGCDGVTYSNAACAAAVGVNVAFDGPCSCISNAYCPAGSYCEKAVGDCAGYGVCEPQPTSCEALLEPVCGCDNVTYENNCEAAMAGVVIQYVGPCMPAMSDYDGDGDVDQTDFGILQRCLSGKGVSQTDEYCQPARMDADTDVDGGDVQAFLACLGGPSTLADFDCIDRP